LTAQLSRAESVWTALGCNVQSMSPEAHDAAFAAVSHLPHLLAFAMMNSIGAQKNADDFLSLAGSGFRDFTRIAASDPEMWHDIFIANRTQLLAQIDTFKQTLQGFENSLLASDSIKLEAAIAAASKRRVQWHLTQNSE
jgi:prephenate dehydrogenase